MNVISIKCFEDTNIFSSPLLEMGPPLLHNYPNHGCDPFSRYK